MAWVNIFDVAGITYARSSVGGTPSVAPTASAGVITFPSGYTSSSGQTDGFIFTDAGGTLAATPEYPTIAARLTFNLNGMTPSGGGLLAYMTQAGLSSVSGGPYISNPSGGIGVVTGLYTGGTLAVRLGVDGSGGGDIAGATFTVEVDITAPAPVVTDFWTEFAGSKETL